MVPAGPFSGRATATATDSSNSIYSKLHVVSVVGLSVGAVGFSIAAIISWINLAIIVMIHKKELREEIANVVAAVFNSIAAISSWINLTIIVMMHKKKLREEIEKAPVGLSEHGGLLGVSTTAKSCSNEGKTTYRNEEN